MARGDAYFGERKFNEAILEYRTALQLDPNQSAAHWGLARSYFESRQPREELWEIRETVRLDPSNREARLRLGQLLILAGELDEGLEQADQVLALEPMNAPAHLLRAQALEAQNKMDHAFPAYVTGLRLARGTEDEPLALRLLASFHTRRKEHDAAGPYYEQLVEIAPDVPSLSALGSHYQRNHEPEAAERAFRRAIEVAGSADRAKAYSALAGFLYDQDRVADGVEVLQKGIAEVEDPLDLTYLLAHFYNLQGAPELADELVRDVARRRPGDIRPYLVLSSYEAARGRLPEALAAVERALEIDSRNPEARVWHAELLVDVGQRDTSTDRYQESRRVIEEVLRENPTNADALVAKAKVDLIQERPKDALASLRAAIEARPNWALAHYRLGSVLVLVGDRVAARAELARALELDAVLVEARKLLARVYQDLGEHEYAVEAARTYLRDRPDDTEVRTRLAQSLYSLNRREEAWQALAPIPEAARTPEVRFALAQLQLAAGRPREARAMLMKALEQQPNSPDLLKSLLALDTRENALDQSVLRIEKALRAEPGNARLQQLRGVAALASGDGAGAEAAFELAVELDPNEPSFAQQLADFYALSGRAPDAIRTYQRALEHNADRAEIHYQLAILYERSGERDQAIERYEHAIRLDPNLAEAKNNLAFLHAEAGTQLDRALELAQQARARLPDDPNTADTLGWVLYKRKLPAAAIEYLREAEAGHAAGDPELGAVRHHLALAYDADGKHAEALDVAERALRDLDAAQSDARERGRAPEPEPAWAGELRAFVKRAAAGDPASRATALAESHGT